MASPFVGTAMLYVTVGLAFAVLKGLGVLPHMFGPGNLNWLRVHFVTIGTALQLVFAGLPAMLSRKAGAPGRTSGETWLQWALLNSGFLLAVTGIVGVDSWTAAIGATLIFVAVWRLAAGAFEARRTTAVGAAPKQVREGLRFYLAAPLYLLVGITMAVSLVFNAWAPGGRQGTLEAHVHANVWGFLALVVAGVLLDLFPALAQAPLARPDWTGRTWWLMNLGVSGLVVGPWVNFHPLTVAGLIVYLVGTAHLLLRLILTLAARQPVAALRPEAVQMALAYLWMIVPAFFAPFIVFAPKLVNAPAIEAAATQGLVNGWVLGVAMAAIPRVLRTRGWLPDSASLTAEPAGSDGSWTTAIALNLGVALIWGSAFAPSLVASALTLGGYGLIAVAWVSFLRRAWACHADAGFVS